jgi:hypothetical protein
MKMGLTQVTFGSAPMTLSNTTLSENGAFGYRSPDGYGGGIGNYGVMDIRNCILSGNVADSGGGIYNQGTMTITNSTLSGNSAGWGVVFITQVT